MNRMRGTDGATIASYFDGLENLVHNLGLAEKLQCVWNADETGLQFSLSPGKVLAKKGSRKLTAKSSNSKEGVTTLVCINVAGKAMPPFCVVKGKHLDLFRHLLLTVTGISES